MGGHSLLQEDLSDLGVEPRSPTLQEPPGATMSFKSEKGTRSLILGKVGHCGIPSGAQGTRSPPHSEP